MDYIEMYYNLLPGVNILLVGVVNLTFNKEKGDTKWKLGQE